jgi:holo-[acyl-carrier protein] synthase
MSAGHRVICSEFKIKSCNSIPTHQARMILGLGTDIVEIERIRRMISRHGDHFLERCFTPAEIQYAGRHRDAAVRFAGRWAAKEAVVKVLGTGFVQGITFQDIEVLPLDSGQPSVTLSGGAAEVAARLGITQVQITISHARNYATATAIGTGVAAV